MIRLAFCDVKLFEATLYNTVQFVPDNSQQTMSDISSMLLLKGWFTAFFSLHDSVYGVQYNMYSWFFFFKKSYFS